MNRRHIRTLKRIAEAYRCAEEDHPEEFLDELMSYEFLQETARIELETMAAQTSKRKKGGGKCKSGNVH